MENTRDIFADLENGYYDNKLPYGAGSKTAERDAVRSAYREESAKIEARFKADAIDWCSLKAHPRAGKAYELAKEYASSRREIVDRLQELADLLLGND